MKLSCLLVILGSLGLTSCVDAPCAQRDCQNGGVCIDGRCDCPDGFTGVNCELSLDPCQAKACHPTQAVDCVSHDDEARCVCADGYEGEECRAPWSEKYEGAYLADEACTDTSQAFRLTVEPGPRFKQLTLSNFHNQRSNSSGAKVVANLIQPRLFDIYEQFMPFGVVSGSGRYQPRSGELQLTYQIIQPDGDTLLCNATLRPE